MKDDLRHDRPLRLAGLVDTAALQVLGGILAEVDTRRPVLAEDSLSHLDNLRHIGPDHRTLAAGDPVDNAAVGRTRLAVAADNNPDCHHHTAGEGAVGSLAAAGTAGVAAVDTADAAQEHHIAAHNWDCTQVRHSWLLVLDHSSVAAGCIHRNCCRSHLDKTSWITQR